MHKILLVLTLLISMPLLAKNWTAAPPPPPSSPVPTSSSNPLLLRILNLEEQRQTDPLLYDALVHPSPVIRRAAILALGRIGDTNSISALIELLNKKRYLEKKEIIFSLSLFQDEAAAMVLTQSVAMHRDPEVVHELYLAMGRLEGEKQVLLVTRPIREGGPVPLVEPSCLSLGQLWAKDSAEWTVPEKLLPQLARAISSRQSYGTACAFAASRFKGVITPHKDFIRSAEENGSPEVKAMIAKALTRTVVPEVTAVLLRWASKNNPDVLRIASFKALSDHPYEETWNPILVSGLQSPRAVVVVQALQTLAAKGAALQPFAPFVEKIMDSNASSWVREQAMKTLVEIDPAIARKRAELILSGNTLGGASFVGACLAMAATVRNEDTEKIAALLQSDNPRIVYETAEALSTHYTGEWPTLWKNALKKNLENGDPAISSISARLVSRYQWKDFANPLASAFQQLNGSIYFEPLASVLSAFGSIQDSSHLPLIQSVLKDPNKKIAQSAVDAWKAITGLMPPNKNMASNKLYPLRTLAEIQRAAGTEVILKTNRGDIVLKMLSDTPLNALNFLQLARNGFYNGLTFHRIVPGFVAQGGDPRGDGFGGGPHLVRDELSNTPQNRGIVGMAKSAPDGASSQFYINLSTNRHLDGRFTAFAKVLSGMDIVDRLEEGDKILVALVK